MDNEYEIFVKDFSECFNEISLSLLNPNSGKKSLQVKSLLNINEKILTLKLFFQKQEKMELLYLLIMDQKNLSRLNFSLLEKKDELA
jgi:hypothetical protein